MNAAGQLRRSTVFVVDDDDEFRDSLCLMLEGVGWHIRAYDNGADFLDAFRSGAGQCLVLDVSMPGLSGLAVQQALRERGAQLPIIFLTGHGSVAMAAAAFRAGAADFFEKPVDGERLIARLADLLAQAAGSP